MSTLAVIGLIVVIVVAGIAIYAATRPATFRAACCARCKDANGCASVPAWVSSPPGAT